MIKIQLKNNNNKIQDNNKNVENINVQDNNIKLNAIDNISKVK